MLPSPSSRGPGRRASALSAGLVLLPLLLASPGLAGEMRVWTSSDGKTVTAELVDATDSTVTIRNEAGREFTFPHERLSPADREIIQAHLAKKKAEQDAIVWPKPGDEQAIPAPFLKKLHNLDPKKFNATYSGRVLTIQGHVLDVREDRGSAMPGILVTLDTGEKTVVEFKFNKAGYDKDIKLLAGPAYNRHRGPYDRDEARVSIADKSIVIEERYVTERELYYTDTISGGYRYRYKWSGWEVVAKPVARGSTVMIRGEFSSTFNSAMSFKDASLADPDTRVLATSP